MEGRANLQICGLREQLVGRCEVAKRAVLNRSAREWIASELRKFRERVLGIRFRRRFGR